MWLKVKELTLRLSVGKQQFGQDATRCRTHFFVSRGGQYFAYNDRYVDRNFVDRNLINLTKTICRRKTNQKVPILPEYLAEQNFKNDRADSLGKRCLAKLMIELFT